MLSSTKLTTAQWRVDGAEPVRHALDCILAALAGTMLEDLMQPGSGPTLLAGQGQSRIEATVTYPYLFGGGTPFQTSGAWSAVFSEGRQIPDSFSASINARSSGAVAGIGTNMVSGRLTVR